MSSTIPKLRCAIYTRKSSEEGLDQAFNSLDAQREACEAYIVSQASMGWKAVPELYDDGGISGGTMERPALQRLLADIKQKKVDVVVVYKIDRLTRSLMDFSRIVEIFDGHSVSFVSITQQFNTTTSMGRLTLNVLLSFAQFEREVTAERIRDKVAASKKKGMWMGGNVPLGYQVRDRKLIADDQEADTVRWLFRRYLDLKSINDLAGETRANPPYRREDRKQSDRSFGRGQLHHLLTNPIYIGKIRHKDVIYDGEHDGIVEHELFEQVQALLKHQCPKRRSSKSSAGTHLLGGLLRDADDQPFLLAQAQNHGRRYKYYISRTADNTAQARDVSWRLASAIIEPIVEQQMHALLTDKPQLAKLIEAHADAVDTSRILHQAEALSHHYNGLVDHAEKRRILHGVFKSIVVKSDAFAYSIELGSLLRTIDRDVSDKLSLPIEDYSAEQIISVSLPIQLKRRGIETRIVLKGTQQPQMAKDPMLIGMVARAHFYLEALTDGSGAGILEVANRLGVDAADISRALPLAFVSPEITKAVLTGQQPFDLTIAKLTRTIDLPMSWAKQSALLAH